MKNIRSLWLVATALCCATVSAHDFEVDGIYYKSTSSGDLTASVTYSYLYSYGYTGKVIIPESVTYNGNTYSVTSIGDWAFRDCSGLTSVTIPNSVTRIGDRAFGNCSGLTSITIPNSVTSIGGSAFSNCSNLASITISECVTSIGHEAFAGTKWWDNQSDGLIYLDCYLLGYKGDNPAGEVIIKDGTKIIGPYAFSSCSNLTSVIFPNSVTRIGDRAFGNCSGLTSITIPNTVTSIGGSAFSNCSNLANITISECVTSIGHEAFAGTKWWDNQSDGLIYLDCYLLGYKGDNPAGEVIIKDGTKIIGSHAFSGCSGLTDITISNSVTSIGDCAFSGCSNLASITIPNSVTSIGGSIFSNCSNLASVIIPESVTSIGESVFSNCSNLASITIPESVTSIGGYAFYCCSSLTNITIPHSVSSIGESAFSGCSSLTNISIPESVTNIGLYAFSDCSGLTSVYITDLGSWCGVYFEDLSSNPLFNAGHLYLNGEEITELVLPESVTSIGQYAFSHSSNLASVTIPNSVTSIGGYAFSNCPNLTSVIFSESVTSIGGYAFYYCSGLTSVTIPNSVTRIGERAFYECSSLTSVHITDLEAWFGIQFDVDDFYRNYYDSNPLSYAEHLYLDGEEITNITIPNSVTKVGEGTFYGFKGLTSVTIPESVTEIGSDAFSYCSNLTNLTIQNPTSFSVLTMTDFCSSAILTVPNGSAKAYNDLGGFWGQFATIKEEANIKIPEANKWSTCALAFDAALPEGVRAFVSTGMEENYVLLEEVTSLSANTPYVLYAQNGYEGTLSGTVDVTNYQTSVTDGALNGAITQQTISEGYVLQNQGEGSKFYNVNEQTFTIPAGKCWLSAISAASARSVMMRFPGGATDIEGLYVERPVETDGKIYTLDGKEVETMQSGHIYIKDGKKVLKR